MRDLATELKALRLYGMAAAWASLTAQGESAQIDAARHERSRAPMVQGQRIAVAEVVRDPGRRALFVMVAVPAWTGGVLEGTVETRVPPSMKGFVKLKLSCGTGEPVEAEVPPGRLAEGPKGLVIPVALASPEDARKVLEGSKTGGGSDRGESQIAGEGGGGYQ